MTHIHRVKSQSDPEPFRAPVSSRKNRKAHGGIMVLQFCRCGHARPVNRNGTHEERGAWGPIDGSTMMGADND
jgi:hypothetical protein